MSDPSAPKPVDGLPGGQTRTAAKNPFATPARTANQPVPNLEGQAGSRPAAAPPAWAPQPPPAAPSAPPAEPASGGRGAMSSADAAALSRAFEELKKGLKKLIFNKHRLDEYNSYLEPAWQLFDAHLATHGSVEIRLEVSTLLIGTTPVLEDDKRENNIVYPLWNEGVRLLVFRHGVTVKDLVRFFAVLLDVFPRDPSEDLLSALWKADLNAIEWVALDNFQIAEGADDEEVEVQVEDVLKYLQDALSSEAGLGVANARVNFDDLDLKLEDVSQLKQLHNEGDLYSETYKQRIQEELAAEEARLLDKICSVMFEVMQLDATEDELQDIAAALEQLLDGLVLQGKFATINRVIEFAEHLSRQAGAQMANREVGRRISERLGELIGQPERVRGVATALNAGRAKSMDELKAYLERLGPHAAVMLLEMMDMLANPVHRRTVADALVQNGRSAVPLFAARIKKASSNLAKDLFYIIDQIDPPDKAQILEPVLNHENAVLRMEVLNILSKAQDEDAFALLHRVFRDHPIAQMRAHAARVMSRFPERLSAPVLVDAVKDEKFDERPEPEQRAVVAAVAQLQHPSAHSWIQTILRERSGLLKGRRVDERKLLIVRALASLPGVPSLKLLGQVVQEPKLHSKEVYETAKDAALKMRDRLQGSTGGGHPGGGQPGGGQPGGGQPGGGQSGGGAG